MSPTQQHSRNSEKLSESVQETNKWITEISYKKKTDKPDYKWLRVTKSDYKWLWARIRVTASDYKRLCDYNWLRAKLRITTTAIGNNLRLRHKNFNHFLWPHNNNRSEYVEKCSKNNRATLLVKIIEKYLRWELHI